MEISAAYPHLVYQIAFSRIRGLTPVRAATILELFGSEEAFSMRQSGICVCDWDHRTAVSMMIPAGNVSKKL